MVPHRIVAVLAALSLFTAIAVGVTPARAEENANPSGNWAILLPKGALSVDTCIASLVLDGTQLTNSMSCNFFGFSQLTGPFEPTDGSFHLSGHLETFDATMDGTVELTGSNALSSLSGTWAALDVDFGKQVGLSGELVGFRGLFGRGIVRCPKLPVGHIIPAREVESVDAQLLLQFVARLDGSFLECSYLGDVNVDGRLDAVDANLILQFVANLIDEFPAGLTT